MIIIFFFQVNPRNTWKHHFYFTPCLGIKHKRGLLPSRCLQSSKDRRENTYLSYKSVKAVVWKQRESRFCSMGDIKEDFSKKMIPNLRLWVSVAYDDGGKGWKFLKLSMKVFFGESCSPFYLNHAVTWTELGNKAGSGLEKEGREAKVGWESKTCCRIY